MSAGLERVLAAYRARGIEPVWRGKEWTARCLAHEDRQPSVSIGKGQDGRALLHCHAGCPTLAVVSALGLQLCDLFSAAGDQAYRRPHLRVVVRIAGRGDPLEDLDAVDAAYRVALNDSARKELARALGLTAGSLVAIGVGWDGRLRAWSFPMRDGDGRLVGFRLRRRDGSKFTRKGGHEGLFLPSQLPRVVRLVVTEGPTDAAALLGLGILAVGRPSCTGGAAHVVRLVRRLRCPDVVIAADADVPGQRGAAKLAGQLLLHGPVRVITPPAKDLREWIAGKGATAGDVIRLIERAPLQRLCVQTGGRQP